MLAAWEKAGEVYFDRISPRTFSPSTALAAPGSPVDWKHPAVAENARGQALLVWTEGTAWMKGGSVAWQLFDPDGRPMSQKGRAPGVPVWGMPSVFTNAQGNFTIVY